MFLLIDNTESGALHLYLFSQKKTTHTRFALAEKNNNHAAVLEKFLRSADCSLKKLKGIAVVIGADGFTAARLIVTFANALAFGLGVPVLGVAKDFTPDSVMRAFDDAVPGVYVAPVYSAEARIGT